MTMFDLSVGTINLSKFKRVKVKGADKFGRCGIVCNELVQMLMQFCQLLSVQIKLFLPSSSFPQYFSSIFNYNQNVGQNEVKGKGKGNNRLLIT